MDTIIQKISEATPMVYEDDFLAEPKILFRDRYKGIEFAVINVGPHPCAYVHIPFGHPLYLKDYRDKAVDKLSYRPHGYFTFSNALSISGMEGWWLGWDYAHFNDYTSLLKRIDGRRWSTAEMILECMLVASAVADYEP